MQYSADESRHLFAVLTLVCFSKLLIFVIIALRSLLSALRTFRRVCSGCEKSGWWNKSIAVSCCKLFLLCCVFKSKIYASSHRLHLSAVCKTILLTWQFYDRCKSSRDVSSSQSLKWMKCFCSTSSSNSMASGWHMPNNTDGCKWITR